MCYVEVLLELYVPDIICLSEHFLLKAELDAFCLPGYTVINGFCRSDKLKGGVCILSRNSCKVQAVNVSEYCVEGVSELAAVRVEMGHQVLIVICLYRPPSRNSQDISSFLISLQDCLDSIGHTNSLIIVTGGFNINFAMDNNETRKVIDLMTSFGLKSNISSYTREFNGSKTCIDNMFSNISQDLLMSSVLITGISDHHAQLGDIKYEETPANNSPKFRKCRKITKDNLSTFKQFIAKESWNDVYFENSLDAKFNCFLAIVRYNFLSL